MKAVVLRAGSWGATLAGVLARNGHEVTLVAPNAALRQELQVHRENREALPGVRIPDEVDIVGSYESASAADLLLIPGPCGKIRDTARSLPSATWEGRTIVCAAKGIEVDTLMPMSGVISAELGITGQHIVSLSGPSFARYVGLEQPTTIVAAAESDEAAETTQHALMNGVFRVYRSRDVLGVELGGALKNVIALAAGMVDGLGYGDNTRAALVTRGLAEIARLGVTMGAERHTFAGLSGMGDLVLTCSGTESRNHYVGEQIGRGRQLDEVLASMVTVAEGVYTARAAVKLARKWGVELPIADQVHRVLFDGIPPREAVRSLMLRDPRPEQWT